MYEKRLPGQKKEGKTRVYACRPQPFTNQYTSSVILVYINIQAV